MPPLCVPTALARSAQQASDAENETIAESVASVTLAQYGLDSGSRSFPYVATWSRETAPLRGALQQIQTISQRLIAATGLPDDI